VRLGDRPGDEEAQPGPRFRAPAGVDAPELLEDQTLLLRGNAWPVILDADEDRAVVRGGTHLDLVSRDRVLGGIRQEIEEELTEPVAVAPHERQRLDHARRHRDLVGSERAAAPSTSTAVMIHAHLS
jgi:hypothetical protein